jgi:hypothetical protein
MAAPSRRTRSALVTMPAIPDPAELLLPEGTRLLHIGPPKTGTTSLQGAFHAAREDLLAQGVRYAGRAAHSRRAVFAAIGRPAWRHEPHPPPDRLWKSLVAEVRRAREPRVVISSEVFADAPAEAIPRIIDDLDPTRVHVAVTLRPLARIMASQWQQAIRGGMRTPFDTWLVGVFDDRDMDTHLFWHRHRHDRLIARWADLVGIERVTAVVVDDRDHELVLRAFEQLLGLRAGTLVATRDVANRSMTLAEAEAVRALNVAFRAEDLDAALLHKVTPFSRYMSRREPGPDEPRVEAPQWALDRAGEVAREMVAAIAASGVRVVGDLERLAAPQAARGAGDPGAPVCIPPDVAASMAMGVLEGSGLAQRGVSGSGLWVEPPEVSPVPTRQIAGVLVRRSRAAATGRLRRLRRMWRRRR